MKGIVFTEFLEFVEDHHGIVMVDKLISNSTLESKGIYSAVGTYDHREMVQLVNWLSKETGVAIGKLLTIYGEHFFTVLYQSYPAFFEEINDCFQFLSTVDNYIHPEVLKLYPDAELPRFETELMEENEMRMVYHSERALYPFAEGIIIGLMTHYTNGNYTLKTELIDVNGKIVRFIITR
jgi:hypothetical protein